MPVDVTWSFHSEEICRHRDGLVIHALGARGDYRHTSRSLLFSPTSFLAIKYCEYRGSPDLVSKDTTWKGEGLGKRFARQLLRCWHLFKAWRRRHGRSG